MREREREISIIIERAEHVCKEAEDAGLKHFTCFVKGRLINRVLETQFPGRCHVEETPN